MVNGIVRIGQVVRKANINGVGNRRKINPDWFTGRTWMRSISDTIGSVGHDIYHVHFEGGARTKLHMHDGDQMLIVTEGAGSLEIFGRRSTGRRSFGIRRIQRTALKPGDIVHIPAGMLHTHGSAGGKGGPFSHIAINVLVRKGTPYKTTWYESDFRSVVTDTI